MIAMNVKSMRGAQFSKLRWTVGVDREYFMIVFIKKSAFLRK